MSTKNQIDEVWVGRACWSAIVTKPIQLMFNNRFKLMCGQSPSTIILPACLRQTP